MFEPVEAPAETRKTGHRWVDLLLSISAIFVSVTSLLLAQDSSRAMERLVQANSMPFLQLESGNATDEGEPGVLAFGLRNAGTGPARIYDFAFVVDGRPQPQDGYLTGQLIRACCSDELDAAIAAAGGDILAAIGNDLTRPVSGSFLAAGERGMALTWVMTPENQTLWRAVDIARQSGRITTRACYCSLFDECWIAQSNVFPPQPVASCAPAANAEAITQPSR